MFIYTFLEALVGIVAGILIAVRTKKSEDITYGKLDKAGISLLSSRGIPFVG